MKTLLVSLLLLAGAVQAQTYPSRPVRVIVPFPPGGTTDIVARLVADRLGATLGQPAVIENRAGAGGAIGAAEIARAAPDGYTLGLATVSTHGVNPAINPKLPYDALRDFTPVSNLASVPNVVSAHPSLGIADVRQLVERAKASPGKITYASAGNGSLSHMLGELFKSSTSTDLLHVPYKGVGPALNDTLGGQVNLLFDNLPSSLPHIQSGKLRALAVSSPSRLEFLPDVPTFAEAGVPQLNDPSWFGLVGPAKLPEAVLARVHEAVPGRWRRPMCASACVRRAPFPRATRRSSSRRRSAPKSSATAASPPSAASASNKWGQTPFFSFDARRRRSRARPLALEAE